MKNNVGKYIVIYSSVANWGKIIDENYLHYIVEFDLDFNRSIPKLSPIVIAVVEYKEQAKDLYERLIRIYEKKIESIKQVEKNFKEELEVIKKDYGTI